MLESKSFLEKMTVLEHTIPFFLPIREAENDLLSSNAMVRLVVLSSYSCCAIFISNFAFAKESCIFSISEIYRSHWGTVAGIC